MNMLTRWEPFRKTRRMHDMIDRIMDESFLDISRHDGLMSGVVPVDIYQTDEDVVVKATMPGVKPEDINISITGEMLTVEGELKEEVEIGDEKGVRYHVRERRYGSYYRSLTLPTMVDADKASAEFENGILTLTLPKVEEVKPKTITVTTK
jgi:HSP20 family protein